jgi:hypothetical protein
MASAGVTSRTAHAGDRTTAIVGRAMIGDGAARGGVIVMVIVVVIAAAIRSIIADINHRTAVIIAIIGIITRITRPIITDISRASRQ